MGPDGPSNNQSRVTTDERKEVAPWLLVPQDAVVSIEHPCVVRDVDNGIKSLGGEVKLSKFLQANDRKKVLGASLRPGDVLAKPLTSHLVKTNNVLLKITVPKRTGRKRKRGSTEPFVADETSGADLVTPQTHSSVGNTKVLLRSLRENPDGYSIQPVGQVSETHKFRSLPDFQYTTKTNSLMSNIRGNIVPFKFSSLKDFKLDLTKGLEGEDVGPPPVFSQSDVHFNYLYHQNAAVTFVKGSSHRPIAINSKASAKHIIHKMPINVEKVPSESPVPLPSEDSLDERTQKAIQLLRAELEKRPIMTRRVTTNFLPYDIEYHARQAWAYVGYVFPTGPWKDALIRFGVDPRSDPKYRFYQLLKFKLVTDLQKDPSTNTNQWFDERVKYKRSMPKKMRDETSHLFDGTRVVPDGKVWQICDITDPLIRKILDTENIRETCDVNGDGWYHNGTIAKAQVIMKDKILALQKGEQPNVADYARVAGWTEVMTQESLPTTALGRKGKDGASEKEIYLGNEIRKVAMDAVRLRRRTVRLKQQSRQSRNGDGQPGTPVDGIDDDQMKLDAEEDEDEDEESEISEDAASEDEGGAPDEEEEDGD